MTHDSQTSIQRDLHPASQLSPISTPTLDPPSDSTFNKQLPRVRFPMRLKLTLPFIILALFFAGAGAFVISQILVDSLQERFTNQLIEANKLSVDRMVVEENERLQTLRLISNTDGVSNALMQRDVERLRQLVWPLAANAGEEAVDLLDLAGVSVLSIRYHAGDSLQDAAFSNGDASFKSLPYVQHVLNRSTEDNQDKYPGLALIAGKSYFFIAGPIFDDRGTRVGVIQVGRSLATMVREFRADTLAHTTIYDHYGNVLATTFAELPDTNITLDQAVRTALQERQDNAGLVRDIPRASINYTELLGIWQARQDTQLGMLGTALPQSFLARTTELTRAEVFLLVLAAMVLVLIFGVNLAHRITRPLQEIVNASSKVARGDLDVTVKPVGNDEIAVLAHAFNRMMVGLRDSTRRRLHEIELLRQLEYEREMRQLKSRFISMVSHELKTPLTAILSSSEFVRTYGSTLTDEKRLKHFNRIQSSVSTMEELVEDVLLIGKTESGRLELNPVELDLRKFCEAVVEEINPLLSNAHSLKFMYKADAARLHADPKLLRGILVNLLSNAVKYSPQGGTVWFQVEATGKEVIFTVQDQGIGIPKKDQKYIFETFHRANNVGSLSGTGLGLYIARMAVELHGGTIKFESQENVGTTFFVTIPALNVAKEQQ